MNIQLGKTQITFLFALGFTLVSGLSLFGLSYVIQTDAEQLRATTKELAYEEAMSEERFESGRLFEETEMERSELESYILSEDKIIDFVNNLESLARLYQLEFITQTISPEKLKDPTFDNLTLDLSFSGRKENVDFMISVLETQPYLSHIKSLALRNNGDNWNAILSLEVTIFDYEE